MLVKSVFFASFVLVGLLGCGELGLLVPEGEGCGDSFCEVHTYCADAQFGSCLTGCKSDINCPVGEICLTGDESVGACMPDDSQSGGDEAPPAWRVDCEVICGEYIALGCDAPDFASTCSETHCQEQAGAESFIQCSRPTDCNYEACSGF